MQWIASQTIWRVSLLYLSLLPSITLAGNSTPEDYLANKSLVLEVRYCECQATEPDGVPSRLLPSFLKESSLLKVGISSVEKGFVSSASLSLGYELKVVEGAPEHFQFNYAGSYKTSIGDAIGNGELVLEIGQWVILFGSRHRNETETQYSNVSVRLAEPGGSVIPPS